MSRNDRERQTVILAFMGALLAIMFAFCRTTYGAERTPTPVFEAEIQYGYEMLDGLRWRFHAGPSGAWQYVDRPCFWQPRGDESYYFCPLYLAPQRYFDADQWQGYVIETAPYKGDLTGEWVRGKDYDNLDASGRPDEVHAWPPLMVIP